MTIANALILLAMLVLARLFLLIPHEDAYDGD